MGFSFSANIQNLPIKSHGRLVSIVTIWDFMGQNSGHNWAGNHQKWKSVTSMELEQRHVIIVSYKKGVAP
jgi:hypothetical protein